MISVEVTTHIAHFTRSETESKQFWVFITANCKTIEDVADALHNSTIYVSGERAAAKAYPEPITEELEYLNRREVPDREFLCAN